MVEADTNLSDINVAKQVAKMFRRRFIIFPQAIQYSLGQPKMVRNHIHHLWHAIDTRPPAVRLVIAVLALASLPLFGAGVRYLGEVLALGRAVLPLLVVAHIPALIAGLALWSFGRDTFGGK